MSTPPQISSALPISGSTSGGTQVNISGSGLSSATSVFFGVAPATEFEMISDTLIFAISPPASTAGEV
ncbi:MAG: IPT/TIG domain-containing protein, partial [Candidatus Sulfotelmatobacter sp.]